MRGATILKDSDDKTRALNSSSLLAFSGEAGDTGGSLSSHAPRRRGCMRASADIRSLCAVQFAEYIQANVQLHTMRNNLELAPAAVAHFVRSELASALRSQRPYFVDLLLGGFDRVAKKPELYWIDHLASMAALPYAAHGYAQ